MWKYKVNTKEEAGVFVKMLIESKSENEIINIGIPGGRSIIPILNEFKNIGKNTSGKIKFYLVDERIDGETNSELLYSNYFNDAVKESLITKDQIIFPSIDKNNIANSISEYEKLLPNKFDVLIFGVGEDCHIASLFPDNTENLSNNKIIFVEESPKPPKERISLSYKSFNKDASIVLLYFGDEKKDALKKTLSYSKNSNENLDATQNAQAKLLNCPASYFFEYSDLHIITDLDFE